MIQTSRPTFGRAVSQAGPDSRQRRWAALLWGLIWRGLVVVVLPIVLPSQAQIGAAQGRTQKLMVGVVGVVAALSLLGLVTGVWRRRGLLGSLNRVAGAAVLVRLAFLGPIELMMAAWIAAVAVAAADWLYSARKELGTKPSPAQTPFVAPRASPFVGAPAPPPVYAPAAAPLSVPPPPWPNRPPRPPHRFGRPVVPWFVALTGVVAIALLAWVSNANLNPPSSASQPPPPATSQPQPGQPPSGHRTTYCTTVAESRVCVSVSA